MAQVKVGIIDYGIGNIRSIMNAVLEVGSQAELVSRPELLNDFDKIILPGVGAFSEAIETITRTGFGDALNEFLDTGKHILGICLGMQLMCRSSSEGEDQKGLGWLDADVIPFPDNLEHPVPHMGWNSVTFEKDNSLVHGIENECDFYFCHSYYVTCKDQAAVGHTEYGAKFASVFAEDNVWGVQFHPEKSQNVGLKTLSNFVYN